MAERLHFHALEKEMATHSSVLAWRIPGTGEPGQGSCRLWGRTESDMTDVTVSRTVYIVCCLSYKQKGDKYVYGLPW